MRALVKFLIVFILFIFGIVCILIDFPDWKSIEWSLIVFVLIKAIGFICLYFFYKLAYKTKWVTS